MPTKKTLLERPLLLVEDDSLISDVYMLSFKSAGLTCGLAVSGKDAIARVENIQEGKEPKPFVILLDWLLPDVSGGEVLKMIREHDVTKDIPVIVVSNLSNSEIEKQSEWRPDKYIMKASITPTELTALVKGYL